jgi:hypothetical protein
VAVNSIAKTDEPVFYRLQSRLIAFNGMMFEHNVVDASEDVIGRTLEDLVFTALDVDLQKIDALSRAAAGERAEDAVLVSAYSWAPVSGARFSDDGRMNCHAVKIAASTA